MTNPSRQLFVLMNGRNVGVVTQDNIGTLKFDYDVNWLYSPRAYPLSLSMPLTKKSHSDEAISAYMWGLLPDNEFVLGAWGKRFQVSARSCFALLGAVGEDCPGAVQFVPPGQLDRLQDRKGVDWLDPQQFTDLISKLQKNPARVRPPDDTGQFSLAGAQAKTALVRQADHWGIPRGRTPTTHILKPAIEEFGGQVENEHFCLRLANLANLPSALSEVLTVGEIRVICTRRYDRIENPAGEFIRLHQEDMCQALGIRPERKYQKDGGPSVQDIMRILDVSTKPDQDHDRFVRAVAFNFVIVGTDAHAKNYSLLITHDQKRLAPLYDLNSYLPYADGNAKIKLSHKIGGHYLIQDIMPRHWEQMAEEIDFPPERAVGHVRDLIARLPGLALNLRKDCLDAGLNADLIDGLVDLIWQRCKTLSRIYGAEELSH